MADAGADLLEDFDEEEAKGGSKVALIAIVLLGIGGGGFAGMSFGGDAVGQILADRAQHAGEDAGGDDGHGGGGGHGAPESGPSRIHMVDNLVVNPARSGGSRFLLTSIAIEVTDTDYIDTVVAADVAIRSALLLVLGAKTTDELTDIENRRRVVSEIRATIIEILGASVVHDVFVPQFVIQ